MSLAGVPLLACFPGEFMILVGGINKKYVEISIVLATVLVISAAYTLRLWLKVFWHPSEILIDMHPKETNKYFIISMSILALATIILGLFFTIVIDKLLIPSI